MNHLLDSNDITVTHADFLVVGSGIAGLTFALDVCRHGRTILLTKKSRAESNTNYAQGGIAGVMAEDDSFELHVQDTLTAGAGLCNEEAVRVLASEGPDRIRDLIALGAQFNHEVDPDGVTRLSLGMEGGHSRHRIIHTADRTGRECERTLLAATRHAPNLTIDEHHFVADLICEEHNVVGLSAIDSRTGNRAAFMAPIVALAAGGCGRVYLHTTNPSIATGDGVALAWRAGATVKNMEFIQFHPTALHHLDDSAFLISEAVRGEGGILRNADGSTFMERYHPLRELAPRDVVARAIHSERLRTGSPCVFLDVTHLPAEFLRDRFPTIYERLLKLGIDITRQPIPVAPAAHYMCGGVATDLNGRTTVPGLYAIGETACTGVHGANRLASNSLLEAMVFGKRAAEDAIGQHAAALPVRSLSAPRLTNGAPSDDSARILDLQVQLRTLMDRDVGIVRTLKTLEQAQQCILQIIEQANELVEAAPNSIAAHELQNMATVANLIVEGALSRHESRGLQFLTDFPLPDPALAGVDTVLKAADTTS